MEKEAAAIDTVEPLDNLAFKSSITRSEMLFITFGCFIEMSLALITLVWF